MQQKKSIILLPSVGMGHLIPMVELAKLFTDKGFAVTVAVLSPPTDTSTTIDPFVARVSTEYPLISFHRFPKVTFPPNIKPGMFTVFHTLRLTMPLLLDLAKEIQNSSNLRSLVVDMFCPAAIEVAEELKIQSHIFFSSAASSLLTFLLLPYIQSKMTGSLRDLGNTPVHFPGLPPIAASDLPIHVQDRGETNDGFMSLFQAMVRANTIMINTFEWLEKRAVDVLATRNFIPGRTTPRVSCIGPLVVNKEGETHECLTWLEAQPEKSVVFLCFGSMGAFSVEQLKEMANGLERSRQRFLWVVRSPPQNNSNVVFGAAPEPDLEALLPEGFMECTKERGMVVKSWAPQTAVLRHKAVGGFVSHCGWNSTLEAVSAGVPMIAWPLYAEQRMNKVFLVEEAKLAVAIDGYDKGLVTAEEVERKVTWLMESEDGKVMRKQAAKAKEEAAAALEEGGSSSRAWSELVRDLNEDGASLGV